jgi:ribosomal protein L24
MKSLPKVLLFCLLTAVAINTVVANSDDNIRKKREDNRARNHRRNRRISPEGEPEPVKDVDGNVVKRRSRLDLKDLASLQDEDDVDFQLMSDEKSESMHIVRDDKPEDQFESWSGRDEDTGHSLTVVTTTTNDGIKVTTGTMYGKNGTVYQIRQLADRDVIVEEVPQTSFDSEMEGPETDTEGDEDVDQSTIDQVDGVSTRRNLRRLDSSSVIDVMVSFGTCVHA